MNYDFKKPIEITAKVGDEIFTFNLVVKEWEQETKWHRWREVQEFTLPIVLNSFDKFTFRGYLERTGILE